MALLEAALAFIGLVLLVLLAIGFLSDNATAPPSPEADLAAPYREGLHSALRIQAAAHDLEHQMYAEALRQARDNPGGEP